MYEADKFFKSIGFAKTSNNKEFIKYVNKPTKEIIFFDMQKKEVSKITGGITMQQLEAINKKCCELRWK